MKKLRNLLIVPVIALAVGMGMILTACSTTQKITRTEPAPVTISKLVITGAKTRYSLGQNFDKTGMKVYVQFSDDTYRNVTKDITLVGKTTDLDDSDTQIGVKYETKTEYLPILVTSKWDDKLLELLDDLYSNMGIPAEYQTQIDKGLNGTPSENVVKALHNADFRNRDNQEIQAICDIVDAVKSEMPVAPNLSYPMYPQHGYRYDYQSGDYGYFFYDDYYTTYTDEQFWGSWENGYNGVYNQRWNQYYADQQAYYNAQNQYTNDMNSFMFNELPSKIYATVNGTNGLTNARIATAIYEIANTFNQSAKSVVTYTNGHYDLDGVYYSPIEIYYDNAILSEYITCYDNALALGKVQFVKAFEAFLDVAKLAHTSYNANIDGITSVLDNPTITEFKSVALSLKADLKSAFNVLTVDNYSAIAKLLGTFAPTYANATAVKKVEKDLSYAEQNKYWAEQDVGYYQTRYQNYSNDWHNAYNAFMTWAETATQESQNFRYSLSYDYDYSLSNYGVSYSSYQNYLSYPSNPDYWDSTIRNLVGWAGNTYTTVDYGWGTYEQPYNYSVYQYKQRYDYAQNSITFYNNEIARLNGELAEMTNIRQQTTAMIDASIADYHYLRNSIMAMLDTIDTNILEQVYDAYDSQDPEIYVDIYAIATAKILDAGLGQDGQGKILDALNADLVNKYLTFYNNSFGFAFGKAELTDSVAQMYGYDTTAEMIQAIVDATDALKNKQYGDMIAFDPYGDPNTAWLDPESANFNFILAMYYFNLVA